MTTEHALLLHTVVASPAPYRPTEIVGGGAPLATPPDESVAASRQDVVVFPDSMANMPCVKDRSGDLVPLFQIFAVMEENTDFVELYESLPHVEPCAVERAVEFIYTRLQSNSIGLLIEPLTTQYGHGAYLFERIREIAAGLTTFIVTTQERIRPPHYLPPRNT